jgi:hypothetical protein
MFTTLSGHILENAIYRHTKESHGTTRSVKEKFLCAQDKDVLRGGGVEQKHTYCHI